MQTSLQFSPFSSPALVISSPFTNGAVSYAGPLDFHRNSLLNLGEAMRRTHRLCATVIDTMGRELMIKGQWQVNDQVN